MLAGSSSETNKPEKKHAGSAHASARTHTHTHTRTHTRRSRVFVVVWVSPFSHVCYCRATAMAGCLWWFAFPLSPMYATACYCHSRVFVVVWVSPFSHVCYCRARVFVVVWVSLLSHASIPHPLHTTTLTSSQATTLTSSQAQKQACTQAPTCIWTAAGPAGSTRRAPHAVPLCRQTRVQGWPRPGRPSRWYVTPGWL